MKGFLNKVVNGKPNGGGAVGGKPSDGGKPSSPTHAEGNMAAMRSLDTTPRADISLPRGRERRRSSLSKSSKMQSIKELPLLSETPMLKREALFRQKLQLCCILFDFEDPDSDVKGKELKRETLVEIAEYVNTPSGQKIFTEALMPDIVQMVRINLLRTLPPQTDDYDPEEDEPAMEIMWPHLQ
eukprot:gene43141-57397_t